MEAVFVYFRFTRFNYNIISFVYIVMTADGQADILW
jgi:hypothetical protein